MPSGVFYGILKQQLLLIRRAFSIPGKQNTNMSLLNNRSHQKLTSVAFSLLIPLVAAGQAGFAMAPSEDGTGENWIEDGSASHSDRAVTEAAAQRAAAAQRVAAQRAAAEKAAAEQVAAEQEAAEKLAAEKTAAEKAATEKAEAEKAEADRLATEKQSSNKAISDAAPAAAPNATTSGDSGSSTTPTAEASPGTGGLRGAIPNVADNTSETKASKTVRLRAEVVERNSPDMSQLIVGLNDAAEEKIRQAELLDKEKHFKKGIAKLAASSRDLAELCTAYRGFEQSSEAADVILDEKLKLKSSSAVAYAKQKQADEVHERLVTAMMQIATGLGTTDAAKGTADVDEGRAEIETLTDKESADKAVERLRAWCQTQKVAFPAPLDGPMQIQAECKDVLGRAIQQDHVVQQIAGSLHKYNGRSKFARATAKVVNTSLSIASMSPTIISPASQIAWTAYIMTQGGPEESKLLKEVYLAKRFETRFQTINSETSLAVNSYNSALLTQNSPLLAFSQFMVSHLCDPPAPPVAPQAEKGLGKKLFASSLKKVALKAPEPSVKPATSSAEPESAAKNDLEPAAQSTASDKPGKGQNFSMFIQPASGRLE